MARRNLHLVGESGAREGVPGTTVEAGRIAGLGAALSDPIRVRMLGMMAAGRGCCELPDCGVPTEDQDAGICVCEFERFFGMGQSKVSYHMRKLKEAGLVREEKRGRWSFYSLEREAAEGLIAEMAGWILPGSETLYGGRHTKEPSS